MEENPCEGCLIEVLCKEMCELAKPFYLGLVTEDKNFDWETYYIRRDKLHHEMLEKHRKQIDKDRLKQETT